MDYTPVIRMGRGYSLWLVPPEPLCSQLQDVIDKLSKEYKVPAFKPHVTLIGPVMYKDENDNYLPAKKAEELFIEQSRKMMGSLGNIRSITVTLSETSTGDPYFKSLFMRATKQDISSALRDAREHVKVLYGQERDFDYAHMSMLYAKFPDADEARLFRDLDRELKAKGLSLPITFTTDRIVLESTFGPVNEWRQLGEFRLKSNRLVVR